MVGAAAPIQLPVYPIANFLPSLENSDAQKMPIAYLTLELRIEAAHSLKDKRQVLRSVKDRLRNTFNISVAEMEITDLWQRATIGVVSISDSRDYLEGLMRNVEREAVKLANNAGAEVVDSFLDYLES